STAAQLSIPHRERAVSLLLPLRFNFKNTAFPFSKLLISINRNCYTTHRDSKRRVKGHFFKNKLSESQKKLGIIEYLRWNPFPATL
ncbi:MAG: hypothetical protein ACXVNN_11110, partial [Bacteroidia bacterium]